MIWWDEGVGGLSSGSCSRESARTHAHTHTHRHRHRQRHTQRENVKIGFGVGKRLGRGRSRSRSMVTHAALEQSARVSDKVPAARRTARQQLKLGSIS